MILVIRKKFLCVSVKMMKSDRTCHTFSPSYCEFNCGFEDWIRHAKSRGWRQCRLAEGYLPLVQSLLGELPAVYHCELESAQFGQDAGLIGAAYWVKDCLLQAKNTGVVYG